ncbi:MAG: AAA family ATPase, partial [Mariprofundaceae bacterium]|nr:AAA family ATPase [Mariprofundaceae bacterium]
MKKRILYSLANYGEIVRKHGYFVDKTNYLAKLETVENPVFLRPRRFGKSLLCSMQNYYYDLNYANQFKKLFGHTWIGKNPTDNHNKFIVVSLNFSVIEVGPTLKNIEQSFKNHCNVKIDLLRERYASILADMPEIIMENAVADNLNLLLDYLQSKKLPSVYLIIDEYDNFANQLVI